MDYVMKIIKLFIFTTVVFLLLDGLWLGLIANKFYLSQLQPILRLKDSRIDTNFFAAFIVYTALISGLIFFVLPLARGSLSLALVYGMAYGFVTYATYDFTNLAVLKDWNWTVALVDVLWGIILCGTTSLLSCWISR